MMATRSCKACGFLVKEEEDAKIRDGETGTCRRGIFSMQVSDAGSRELAGPCCGILIDQSEINFTWTPLNLGCWKLSILKLVPSLFWSRELC
jgi:hypothetical protein